MARTKHADDTMTLLPLDDSKKPEQPKSAKRTAVAIRSNRSDQPAKVTRNESAPSKSLLASLFTAISDPNVDPAKMHALLDARERVMREQAEVEFMSAYIRLQAKLPRINRDGKLDQGETRSGRKGVTAKYATFENINAVTRPILAEEKFGMLLLPDNPLLGQSGIIIRGKLVYVCETDYGRIVHAEQCVIPVPSEVSGGKNAAQGVGSSLSYGKRYGAIALLNLVSYAKEDRDDDAAAAGQAASGARQKEIDMLTKKQVDELRKAITNCGATENMFCTRFQIDKIENMPPTQFGEALQACRSFAERTKGAARGS